MKYTYKTIGTCSRVIEFEVENDKVKNVSFVGGCNGNLKGISALGKTAHVGSFTRNAVRTITGASRRINQGRKISVILILNLRQIVY